MRVLNFILSHSIFIAFCAGGLAYQTFMLLGEPFQPEVFGLVFFSTLAAYNTYWILCKLKNDKKNKISLQFNTYSGYFILIAASAIAVLDYLWQNPAFFPLVLIASFLTFIYMLPIVSTIKNRFHRKAGIIKTILLAFTWSFFTVLIPSFENAEVKEINLSLVTNVFLMRFFFMLMLCIIFDFRDVAVDKLRNLTSIATDFSKKTISGIMISVLACYVFSVFGLYHSAPNNKYLFILLLMGALTFIIYILSLKTRGYYFYYFLVDGLMILSALSLYMATI